MNNCNGVIVLFLTFIVCTINAQETTKYNLKYVANMELTYKLEIESDGFVWFWIDDAFLLCEQKNENGSILCQYTMFTKRKNVFFSFLLPPIKSKNIIGRYSIDEKGKPIGQKAVPFFPVIFPLEKIDSQSQWEIDYYVSDNSPLPIKCLCKVESINQHIAQIKGYDSGSKVIFSGHFDIENGYWVRFEQVIDSKAGKSNMKLVLLEQ